MSHFLFEMWLNVTTRKQHQTEGNEMNKFSIEEFAKQTIEAHPNKRDYWNFTCGCGKHPSSIANVKLSEVPAIAKRLGFADELTSDEFYKSLSHAYLATA